MADRRAQILALLDTRYDHLPEPIRRDASAAGFVHETVARQVCPTCDGCDPERANCTECRGRGWIEERRHRDPMSQAEGSVVPEQMRKVTPYGLDEEAREHRKALDSAIAVNERELERLGVGRPLTERDTVDDADRHPYGWELARRRMYAQYDYRPLDVALERLAGLAIAPHSDRGLELLDLWLPDPLRAPEPAAASVPLNVAAKGRGADERARRQRDQVIVEMVAAGHAYGHIARTVGLSPKQLRRIVGAQNRLEGEAA